VSLPVGLTTITVTGTYLTAAGTPLGGTVLFAPSVPLTDMTGQAVLSANPIVAAVSHSTGQFSVVLPCTDNADLLPAGWAYSVQVNVPGAAIAFDAYLPSSWGSTVDISRLGPVPLIPAQPGLYVISVNGVSGAVSLPSEQGFVTLTGGTATVATAAVATGTPIFLTAQTPSGTPGALYVAARAPGVSFTIESTSSADASIVAYQILAAA